MFRRISSRLSDVMSSLNGTLVEVAAVQRDDQARRKNPPSTMPPVPSYEVRLLVSPCG